MDDQSMEHAIRPVQPEEWAALKELRLAALQDPVAHLAFFETYEEAVVRPDLFWQRRALDAAQGKVAYQLVAEASDTRLVGTVTVLVEEPGTTDPVGGVVEHRQGHLVAVYVRPEGRGSGLIDALLGTALDWAWSQELPRVRLLVHERNVRADRAYRKAGFLPSGKSPQAPGDPSSREVELVVTCPM